MNNDAPPLVLEPSPIVASAPAAPAPRTLFSTLTDEDWRRTIAVIRAREKREREAENEILTRPLRRP